MLEVGRTGRINGDRTVGKEGRHPEIEGKGRRAEWNCNERLGGIGRELERES